MVESTNMVPLMFSFCSYKPKNSASFMWLEVTIKEVRHLSDILGLSSNYEPVV